MNHTSLKLRMAEKKIALLLFIFCAPYLHARQITLIKNKSATDINVLTYLAYKTKTNGKTIIDFEKNYAYFKQTNKATFTIKDTDTHLALMFFNADETICNATGHAQIKPGSMPLTYILHYNKENHLLILIPAH